MSKISVYIPAYNCGKYLEEAIESVLNQNYQDFELIVVDDASKDNTAELLEKYKENPKVRIIKNKKNQGFVRSAIKAIDLSRGKYICRLDADDYLDESALLVMVNILDKNPEIGLVYPDYFHINEKGEIIDYFRKKKIGREATLLDLPPNSGGIMIRKSYYKKIGGYRKDIRAHDKYDLWVKFISKFKPYNVYNVNLPLYYYRQHATNISNETKYILQTRKYIKKKFIEEKYKKRPPKVLGIIPSRAKSYVYPDFLRKKLAGKPVIHYSIKAMKNTDLIDRIIFVTEDQKLANYAQKYGVDTVLRPLELARATAPIEETIDYILKQLAKKEKYFPQAVALLYATSPLITSEHIREAINTLLIYNADSVISVKEDRKFHYSHGKYGLEPLYKKRLLRYEKDLLFEEIGSLIVTKTKFITKKNLLGKKVSHILLTEDEAIDIDNKFQFWLAEQIIKNKNTIDKLV